MHADLYANEDKIEQSLLALLKQIRSSSEDIKLLLVRYILEILEQKDTNEIRKKLISTDMLEEVSKTLLLIQHDNVAQSSKQLCIATGKCIAFIGLCRPFTHDRILLKASNQ